MSTKTSVDKSLLVNFFFVFRDERAECDLVGSKQCSNAATSSWLGQWRQTNIFWRTGVSIQILTEEVFPAQDRHASNSALVQACREIESGFIPGWRSLGKGGGARFSAKSFCFQK